MRVLWVCVAMAGCTGAQKAEEGGPEPAVEAKVAYPEARRDDAAVDTYFGVDVPDPYRWLEDPDSDETRAWIAAENALTASWLADVPERDAIRDRLRALWNYERYWLPRRMGGQVLYEHNDGLQDQNVLMIAPDAASDARVLLDANTLSADGTVPLTSWALSPDGKHLVYGSSDGGSDWNTLHVRDVATGEDLPDALTWVKFSEPGVEQGQRGVLLRATPKPAAGAEDAALEHQKVFYHRLGTDQADDEVVLEAPEQPRFGFDLEVTDDGRWLVATVGGVGRALRVWVRPAEGGDWRKVLDAFDAMYRFVDNDGDALWVWTDRDAPKGRLVRIDVAHPAPDRWTEVIPEGDDLLDSVHRVGDRLLATYLVDAHSAVRVFDLQGAALGEVALPGLGTVEGFDGEAGDTDTFFSFTSFTTPTELFRYDLATGEVSPYRAPEVDFDGSRYVTEQVWYRSADGTDVPMFVVRRRDAPQDGEQPTLLYGYGGFNIPLTPTFSVPNAVWLEMGGVYVSANLRGGGEFGREWHEAGTQLQKQHVFDDFIAAAEHLVASGWTRPERLAIHGRSNGGLLVGATLLQRPDLFGAALPAVGVMDMLKYHTWTIGWGWAADYGTSAQSPEMFAALRAYSPVHNAAPGVYPPTMVLTGDHDDRVVPAHSFKFAAALQAAQQGSAPVLARIDTRAGHGAGKSVGMQIEERADMWAFLVSALDMQLAPGFAPETEAP
ncbi:MAG: prolyl oligopeptidase family serine peptidase [Myxococcota bacterium]